MKYKLYALIVEIALTMLFIRVVNTSGILKLSTAVLGTTITAIVITAINVVIPFFILAIVLDKAKK